MRPKICEKNLFIILTILMLVMFIMPGCYGIINNSEKGFENSRATSNIENNGKEVMENSSEIKEEENNTNKIGNPDASNQDAYKQENENVSSLGGISLGNSPEIVVGVLGNNYIESVEQDYAGIIGEDIIVWSYDNGITVSIGQTSRKVLRVTTSNTDFKTNLGIKVGDKAGEVFEIYKPKFEAVKSRHSNEILEGWYLLDNETVIIFDFDKSDDTLVNSSVTTGSKVEEVVLAYWKHFD